MTSYGGCACTPDGRRVAIGTWKSNTEVWALENFLPKPSAVPSAKPKEKGVSAGAACDKLPSTARPSLFGCGSTGSCMHAWRLVAGALHILDIRARVEVRLRVVAALPAEFQHPVAEAAEEGAVV